MILSNTLRQTPPQRELWSDSRGVRWTAANITSWLERAKQSIGDLRGSRVAVLADRDVDLASLLLVLDGWVDRVVLMPAGSDIETRHQIAVDSGCECGVALSEIEGSQRFAVRRLTAGPIDQERTVDLGTTVDGSATASPTLPTQWVLPTSGTTGRPKLVSHTLETLSRTVKADPARGAEFTWGSLYGLGSFAGLQVFLQSWISGSRFVFSPPELPLAERIRHFASQGCNAMSATPTMWRMVLMSGAAEALDLRRITLGGEICDQAILDALRKTFPDAKIVHIYASTEAGVGFSVRDAKEGFPVAYTDGDFNGVQLRISPENRLLIKRNGTGQSYVNSATPLHNEDGFIDTGDLVERCGDRFLFRGRSSGVINVGGMKVHPQDVEAVLLQHPWVDFAKVTAKKNAFTGALVAAEVVLSDASGVSKQNPQTELIRFCRERLAPHQVPAIISLVDSIDISATGKIVR